MRLNRFSSNSSKRLGDVICPTYSIKCREDGIVLVRLHTVDKYVSVDYAHWVGPQGRGVLLNIMPIIDGVSPDTVEEAIDYFEHKDWWAAELEIDYDGEVMIKPLKHEYLIVIIPSDKVFDHTGFEQRVVE